MAFQTVLDNEWATVQYNDTDKYIYHIFKHQIGGQPFRSVMNTALDALKKNGATKWLSDDRKNAEFSDDDIQFSVGDWGPRAAAVGWKHWALVVPEDVAGRASMQAIVEAFYNLGVQVAIFTNVEEAQNWLVSL